MNNESFELIDKAVNGDKEALSSLLSGVQDMIYNLSLRMLGSPHDAEDINAGFIPNTEDLMQNVDEALLTEELKMSCTNVMLQCLDPESRCIYVLGTMFKADSRLCGEILNLTPEVYRQRLSRTRKKVADFLGEYCGLSTTGKCDCQKRLGFAVKTHRLNPKNLEYSALDQLSDPAVLGFMQAMEEMDELSLIFANLPKYRVPQSARLFLERILASDSIGVIKTEA